MSSPTSLIALVNRLHDIFNMCGSSPLSLPQLVVVGSQSSGKSSVLETIVGRDFLPRGTGIVTRRPLVLQLINSRDEDDSDCDDDGDNDSDNESDVDAPISNHSHDLEYGVFLHIPHKKFYDFNDIRSEIETETNRLTGSNKAISSQPIALKLFSPNYLPLTLVDLPGLTKIPVGDQPSDIEAQIRSMCLSFIASPHSIIIAVTPANSDLANSDALQIAAQVDPHGHRTLGVLTKIDLMDKGTDCLSLLNGELYRLSHGFIGVVCRSQHDINTGKSIALALKSERAFFHSHSVYQPMAHRLGTHYLTRRLHSMLMEHIQSVLPELRAKITATISETQHELDSYGKPLLLSDTAHQSLLLPIIHQFTQCYSDALDGKSQHFSLSELNGGARLHYVFNTVFTSAIMRLSALDSLTDRDIRTAIRNASGPRTALFIPEMAFEILVKKQIERLLLPSLDCVDLISVELKRIATQCQSHCIPLQRFPLLSARLMECVTALLEECVEPTKSMINNLIQCELSYINTAHPDFIGGSSAVNQVMQAMQAANSNGTAGGGLVSQTLSMVQHAHAHAHSQALESPMRAVKEELFDSADFAAPSLPQSQSGNQRQGWLSMLMGGASSIQSNNSSANVSLSTTVSNSPVSHSRSLSKLPFTPPSQRTHRHHPSPSVSSPTPALESNARYQAPSPLPSHPQPQSQSTNVSSVPPLLSLSLSMTDREQIEVSVIKSLIASYFLIVKKTVSDLIPKSVVAFMVNSSRVKLQSSLIANLYDNHQWRELLIEGDEIKEKRKNCQQLLKLLQQALEAVHEARDFQAE